MKEQQLIFIVSQPRSGSTYLQNLLSNNDQVNTCSEPWILLNFINQIKPDAVETYCDNRLTKNAFLDYLAKFPEIRFTELQKELLLKLYAPLSLGFEKVIDKTPRYWEILDEILQLFPKSKIIILKRNPICVLRSIIKTWELKTLLELSKYKRDLLYAPVKIHEFVLKHKENENIYVLSYEELIMDEKRIIKYIYKWLDIRYSEEVHNTQINEKYKGLYGDPFQNSKDYFEAKNKASNKKSKLLSNINEFEQGYINFLSQEFLRDYGNYEYDYIVGRTDMFDCFRFINENIRIDLGIKNEIKFFLKKLYFKIKFKGLLN